MPRPTAGDVPPWEDLPPEAMDHADAGEPAAMADDAPPFDPREAAVADGRSGEVAAEAPATVAVAVPSQPTASSPPSQDLDWHALIREVGLKGMVRELAQHCLWGGMADGEIRLTLDAAHKHLLAMPSNQERLHEELKQYFDQPVRLRIEVGAVDGETPAQRDAADRRARHAQAVAALEQDPFVQEMIERFDATLQEASVRPL